MPLNLNNLSYRHKRLIIKLFLFIMPPLTLLALFIGPFLIGDHSFKLMNLFPISQQQQVSKNAMQSNFFILTNCLFLFVLIAIWISGIYVVNRFDEVLAYWLKAAIYQCWILLIVSTVLIINYAFFEYLDFTDAKAAIYVNYTRTNFLAIIIFIISIFALVYFNKLLKKEKIT